MLNPLESTKSQKLNTKPIPYNDDGIQFTLIVTPIASDGFRSIMVIPSFAAEETALNNITITSKIEIAGPELPELNELIAAINSFQSTNNYPASLYVDQEKNIIYCIRQYLCSGGLADDNIIAGLTFSAISSLTSLFEFLVANINLDLHQLPASHEMNSQIRIPASPEE